MRTIKELLILLREKLPENITKELGGSICWTIDDLWADDIINDNEYGLLSDCIKDNIPEDVGDYANDHVRGFWWPYGKLAPRLEFLDKLIAEL